VFVITVEVHNCNEVFDQLRRDCNEVCRLGVFESKFFHDFSIFEFVLILMMVVVDSAVKSC
jgi:hypothetical protein